MRGVAIGNKVGEMSVGRDAILDFCFNEFGFSSWQTVRNWKRKYRLPVRRLPSNKPYIFHSEVRIWAVKYADILKQKGL